MNDILVCRPRDGVPETLLLPGMGITNCELCGCEVLLTASGVEIAEAMGPRIECHRCHRPHTGLYLFTPGNNDMRRLSERITNATRSN